MKIWMVPILFVLASGCGRSSTGCSLTISGDAASGLGTFSAPCGYEKSYSVEAGYTLAPAVEFEEGDTATDSLAQVQLDSSLPDTRTGAGVSVHVNDSQLPMTQFTERTTFCGSAGTGTPCATDLIIQFIYAGFDGTWIAKRATDGTAGTFTFQLTSAVPTAVSDCDSGGAHADLCLSVHGTAHAVLVPEDYTGNPARGTLTMDIIF